MSSVPPTPWQYEYDNDGNGHFVQWYEITDANGDYVGRTRNDENLAAYIVKAVNQREQLVAALEHASLLVFDLLEQQHLMGDEATEQVEADYLRFVAASREE